MANFRSSAAYRIATTYAAILAWAVLLLGATVYYSADLEFDRRSNEEIAGEARRLLTLEARGELQRELRWRQATPTANRFIYEQLDSDGKEIASGLDPDAPPAAPEQTETAAAHRSPSSVQAGIVELDDGTRLIVKRNLVVDRMKRTIFDLFAAASLAVLVVSVVAGLVLNWYLRSRLNPIKATADAIATGEVKLRVPVRIPGDEFDGAGNAINIMLDRIESLMENLRQVSSDIAHDLRKPLMRLLVQTDRLGEVEGAQQRVYELGDEMLMLFSGILRIAEVEGGGLERSFARVDLSELMSDVAESFAPALADSEHRIEWSIAPDVWVMGNRELLAQLASNLLDNARIHTPHGTSIALGLVAEGALAKLWVEDDGPGVPDEDRDKLLQRFFRAEASRTTPGNGLGLSLVAAASHAHGGTVVIEDAGPGLRILVTLPRVT